MAVHSELTTKEEIVKLPLSGQIALAARCARRVLPIFESWAQHTERSLSSLGDAIAVAKNQNSRPAIHSHARIALRGCEITSQA